MEKETVGTLPLRSEPFDLLLDPKTKTDPDERESVLPQSVLDASVSVWETSDRVIPSPFIKTSHGRFISFPKRDL